MVYGSAVSYSLWSLNALIYSKSLYQFNVVEGLGVWYKPQNGDDQVFVEHGSPLTEAKQSSSVKLAGR